MAAEKIVTSVIALSLLARSMAVPEKPFSPGSPPTVERCPKKQLDMKVSWPLCTKIPCVVKCKKKQLFIRIRAESITKIPPPRKPESKRTSRNVMSS